MVNFEHVNTDWEGDALDEDDFCRLKLADQIQKIE